MLPLQKFEYYFQSNLNSFLSFYFKNEKVIIEKFSDSVKNKFEELSNSCLRTSKLAN